jgi:hypothetical protein
LNVPLNLAELSDQSLIDLAAQLAAELGGIEAERLRLEALMKDDRRRLLKPGAKLSLNAVCAVVGIALAPATLGLSLGVTVVSAAVTAWDGIDYGRDAAKVIGVRLQARNLRDQAKEIDAQLAEIASLLATREHHSVGN